MKNSFTRNLQIGFSISLIILLISSLASYISIKNLLTSSEMVDHTNNVIQELDGVISTMKDAETGQRGYLLTGNEVFLDPYKGSSQKALSAVKRIKSLTIDNDVQQQNCDSLQLMIGNRLNILQNLIDLKQQNRAVSVAQLLQGKSYMDQTRALIKKMEQMERSFLQTRTEKMNAFAGFTPIVIIIAAILALGITISFYFRLISDFKERERLQQVLAKKDEDITRRIDIIQKIAEQISAGDYTTRVADEEKDNLGSLSLSLNKMAGSLEYSFSLLQDKEWLQAGIAGLNDRMIGDQDLPELTGSVMEFVADYTGSQLGSLYILENDQLNYYNGYAFLPKPDRRTIKLSDGIVGQVATSGKQIIVKDVDPEFITVSYAAGEIRPREIIVTPIFHENKVKGVVGIASVNGYSDNIVEFINTVSRNIGIAIYSSQNRKRLQELLEETQSQSEELQAQHSELENLNTELEAQAQKLQVSEEELRVQQEELLQANQELEERSRLLEEKNQVIVERNIDIQRKAEELEISTKYKSEFLANMSHELRTPLNSILLLSRLLSENTDANLNDEQVESAKVIQSSGNGLLSLIDEILDLSKIESGKMDLEYSRVTPREVVNDLQSLFSPIAREKNLALNISIAENAPQQFETDRMRLDQILKNLLSNALKFTTKGSVNLEIDTTDDSNIKFVVTDTGIGIPKEKQKLIFEAFQQADGSTRRKFGGTGLGLSISRELAKLLGGDIQLESQPDKGSTFILTIPPNKPDENATTEAPVPAMETFKPERTVSAPSSFIVPEIPEDVPDDRNNIQQGDNIVLIVEDDTNFAKALLNFTHKRNYKGIVVVRGDQALDMALHYSPKAILLDIQLPMKDGWQVMNELKTNSATRHIPVHIMSSMEVKKESLMKGAVDFINKPVAIENMQQMFQKLEDALNRHPKKVLIVEENPKHAKALAYFLESFNINAEIKDSVSEGVNALQNQDVDCVILDMGIPDQTAYQTLETVKQNPGLENLPIIIFTGKNLSKAEESRIKKYADSIVVKTAHSYQRILDEIALFLHLVEEKEHPEKKQSQMQRLGMLNEVLKNKKVLIADDDVRNIFSLTKALEQHQMNIISATDGKEALKQLQENPDVDLILMDMMMPELDGYETTTQIRQNPKYKNLPILAVTAKAMLGDREKCISAGASDYISKPVDIDQLLSLLRVWLYDKAF
ncbi:response regulator [Pedobacter sp. HMF7647]|uniref:histidine kinase n=1 Tax=Hufsiella arboris TaxID=2695275 RepID=A0A7K1YBK3_9SPHI|nr:response regulator [Hufsiella arboris]MXV51810.1 response regulator [Hufsiella arboris]